MKMRKSKNTGVGLLEVLATVAVLSVGLLGASSMQLLSLKASSASHYRVQATALANSLIERMRFNAAGVQDGKYTSSSSLLSCNSLPTEYENCSENACNSDQLALFDLQQINCGLPNITGIKQDGITNQLPQASLSISCGDNVCGENIEHILTISWISNANSESNNSADESVTLSFIP